MRWSLHLLVVLACVACARPAAVLRHPSAATPAAAATPAPIARSLPVGPAAPGTALGVHGAVSSAEQNASAVGVDVLRRSGNAIDAAIAVAFVLAVTHPTAGNIGGGGFMVVRTANGATAAIDYREAAPLAATRDMYLDASGNPTRDSLLGPRAAGIPGTVAGLALAHRRFGTRPWAELLAPAVQLARDGHALDQVHAEDMAKALEAMHKAGYEDTAKLYANADGSSLHEGDVWRQPELAHTLELIAQRGPQAFYEEPLAQTLSAGMQKLGGLWTVEDLRRYRAIERPPIIFEYRGHQIVSMPPPSSGGIVLRQILGASELLAMREQPWRSVAALHLYVEAARRAYADRNELLGDPDFVRVPTEKLISTAYIASRMKDIDPAHATPSASIHGGLVPAESKETTHFSVIDEAGNAVSNTYTLNTGFGAKVAIPGTGVLLNDEMDDFAAKPGTPNIYGLVQSEANAIAPGKRMLSSMTPTIVVKAGAVRAVIGTPGGPTIINSVAQVLLALIDHGKSLDEAVRAPRLHHQWLPDQIVVEPSFESELEQGLIALGHQVVRRDTMGQVECIEVDPVTHGFRAVADITRRYGAAAAY